VLRKGEEAPCRTYLVRRKKGKKRGCASEREEREETSTWSFLPLQGKKKRGS